MSASAVAVLSLVMSVTLAGVVSVPRASASPATTVPGMPTTTSVIGLLELPSVLGHDGDPAVNPPPPAPRRAIPVFDGKHRKLRELGKAEDFQTEEHSYEAESVVVYEREPGWYRVGLGGNGARTAWVRAEDTGTFRSVATLLRESAAYLDSDWDGRLWPSAGGVGEARRSSKKKAGPDEEYAVDVDETREIDGRLWLHVRLYANDPCESGDTSTDEEGWVPAYGKGGALTAWFWSRGC